MQCLIIYISILTAPERFLKVWLRVRMNMVQHRASRRVEEGLSRSFSRSFSGLAGNPGFPRLLPATSGSFSGCLWEVMDTVELEGASRDSTGFGAMEQGLISSWGRNLTVPLHFWLRLQGPCRVGTGESGLVLCGGMDLRLPLELFTRWQATCRAICGTCGFSLRYSGVLVPLRVVPSSTGLPSKRFPGIGFFSRADQEIGVFRHVAPPTRLRLEFPPEKGDRKSVV